MTYLLFHHPFANKDFIKKNRAVGKSITILMCDIDDFKNVNDTYGHNCGDRVLKNVANTISNTIQDKGVAFRYGGEEFLVVLDADKNEGVLIANEIRENVHKNVVKHNVFSLTVTITIGLTTTDDTLGIDGLISMADARMYKGKQLGKNKVVDN